MILLGEPASHSERTRKPFLDECLRERRPGGRPPHDGDLLGVEQAGGTDHIGDEVAVARAAAELDRVGLCRGGAVVVDDDVKIGLGVHFPRSLHHSTVRYQ